MTPCASVTNQSCVCVLPKHHIGPHRCAVQSCPPWGDTVNPHLPVLRTVNCGNCGRKTQIPYNNYFGYCYPCTVCKKCGKKYSDVASQHCHDCMPTETVNKVVYGYRQYDIGVSDNGIVLRGAMGQDWELKEMLYRCQEHSFTKVTDCYKADHGCGIYVVKNLDELRNSYGMDVTALVTIWGDAMEFERGWRASNVRIERIGMEREHTTLTCTLLGNKYRVPIDCLGAHVEKEDSKWALYGSMVHGLVIPELLGWNQDIDMYMTKDYFFNNIDTFSVEPSRYWRPDPKVTKVLGQGKARLRERSGLFMRNIDAQILDVDELSIETMKDVLCNGLDFRCNAVVYWKGQVHELIPGAIEDIKLKRLVVLPSYDPARHFQRLRNRVYKRLWHLDGGFTIEAYRNRNPNLIDLSGTPPPTTYGVI